MDRYVIVKADSLDDLCQLSALAVERLRSVQPHDPLNSSLTGVIAEVRAHSLLEPA